MTLWRSPYPDLDPTPAMLFDEVLGEAERWAERVAVADAVSGASLTYAELVERARRLAGRHRGRVVSRDQLGDALTQADLVISST
jgi:non-ribosomal peptide synthetase component F